MQSIPLAAILGDASPVLSTVGAGSLSLSRADGLRACPTLWFLSGQTADGEAVRHVPVHSSAFRIGRRSELSLSLTYATVSGLHAEINERNDRLYLRDIGSKNGTFVNGQRIHAEVMLKQNDLVQFADVPFRVRRHSAETGGLTLATRGCDYALALVQFDQLMTNRAVIPYFQPVVDLQGGGTIGYEMLGRSDVYGLEMPDLMFHAASQLELEVELSRMFRWEAVRASSNLTAPPHVFVNTHPDELVDPDFIPGLAELRKMSPCQPITLEIHETAVADVHTMTALRSALRDLDMRLAYDDFGAGQDRLIPLIEVRPDYLKFDMALIRDIDRASPARQRMLETLVTMVSDLGIVPLAEGIETQSEGTVCRQIGFHLAQGYFYGRPAPAIDFETAWRDPCPTPGSRKI